MRTSLVCAVVAFLVLPARAGHASEGERAVSIRAGYASVSLANRTTHGALVGLDFEYGLSDAVWLRASGSGGAYDDDGSLAWSAHGVVGLTYVIDVLKYVPYFNLGAGLIAVDSEGDDEEREIAPIAELGAGLDVLSSRSFSYGGLVRVSALTDTTFFTVSFRATWRSGFF